MTITLRAMVTGASGFVGRHLVESMIATGADVTVLARPSSSLPGHWIGRVTRADLAGWTLPELERALSNKPFEVAFHLAAYGVRPIDRDPDQLVSVNVMGTAEIVRLCRRREANLVVAGSSAEYCEPVERVPLAENAALETGRLYGASKAAGTMLATALANDLGTNLRVLRLFNVFGPGEDRHRLLPSLVSGLSKRELVPLSVGTQIRDFIYIGDAVEALLAAARHMHTQRDVRATIMNVCTGTGTSVHDFALTVARAFHAEEDLLAFGALPQRKDDIPWLVGDRRRIKAELGWEPAHDLDSGIRATLDIMRSR